MVKGKRHPKKKKVKPRKYTKIEVDFILKMNSISLIYLDNAMLGYKTDEEDKQKCGEDFKDWTKQINAETVISFVNIYELRPLFFGKIVKAHPDLSVKVVETLVEYNPQVITEKATQKLAKDNKKLWLFLKKEVGLGDEDAAHFTIAVAANVDLFVSFNKRAFKNNDRKIRNKLIEFGLKMPLVWTFKDIKKNMELYKGLGYNSSILN